MTTARDLPYKWAMKMPGSSKQVWHNSSRNLRVYDQSRKLMCLIIVGCSPRPSLVMLPRCHESPLSATRNYIRIKHRCTSAIGLLPCRTAALIPVEVKLGHGKLTRLLVAGRHDFALWYDPKTRDGT